MAVNVAWPCKTVPTLWMRSCIMFAELCTNHKVYALKTLRVQTQNQSKIMTHNKWFTNFSWICKCQEHMTDIFTKQEIKQKHKNGILNMLSLEASLLVSIYITLSLIFFQNPRWWLNNNRRQSKPDKEVEWQHIPYPFKKQIYLGQLPLSLMTTLVPYVW